MSFLLGLAPGLLEYLPHILGGLGVGGALLGFLPGLQKYALIGLAVVAALAIGWGLLERGNYQAEKAGRIADAAAAQAEVLKQQQAAAKLSDELVIQQAIAMGNTGKKAGSYVDQIRKAPDADRMRVGSRGVHDLIAGGGGGPAAVGGAAPAVPGSGARGGP